MVKIYRVWDVELMELNVTEDSVDSGEERTDVVRLTDCRKLEQRLMEKDKMYTVAVALQSQNAELATKLASCEAALKSRKP